MAARNDDAVRAAGKSLQQQHEVDAPGTRETHDLDVRGVLQPAGSGQVGPGVGTPVADEGHDIGFEFCFIFVHCLSYLHCDDPSVQAPCVCSSAITSAYIWSFEYP